MPHMLEAQRGNQCGGAESGWGKEAIWGSEREGGAEGKSIESFLDL